MQSEGPQSEQGGPGKATASAPLSPAEDTFAVNTWRYLRLAMIVLVLGLGASVGYERWKNPQGCFQTSISAYYYTPVQAVFVGVLVAIGVCLLCVKGNTAWEDILLNLAGMFAPVVAFVPTPKTGSCASVLGTTHDRDVNIGNNVFALLVIGGIALLILVGLEARNIIKNRAAPTLPAKIGYGLAAALWLVAVLVFGFDRGFFTDNAHYTAAIAMFVCIFVVVVLNALGFDSKSSGSVRNRYGVIAGAMILAAVGTLVAGRLGWDYWILAIEVSLISLFAVFWMVQTKELWHTGLRTPKGPSGSPEPRGGDTGDA